MKDIKEKSKVGKDRTAARPALAPKQAAKLLKDKYVRQLEPHTEETENKTGYAVEQVEDSGRFTVDKVSIHAQHYPAQKHSPKERPRPSESTVPSTYIHNERIGQPQSPRAIKPSVKAMKGPDQPPQMTGGNGGWTNKLHAREHRYTKPPKQRAQHQQSVTALPDSIVPKINSRSLKGYTQQKGIAPKTRKQFYAKAPLRPQFAQSMGKAASRTINHTAQKRMVQQMVKQAQKAGKSLAITFRRIVQVAIKAAAAFAGSVIGLMGGGILLILMVVVIIIAAIANSPFGLFFAGESGSNGIAAVSVAEAVAQVNMAYNDRLDSLQTGDYDDIDIIGSAPDWTDVLAVFAVRFAAADNGVDVATLDDDRVHKLIATFWDMTDISSTVEVIDHPDSDPDDDTDDSWTECILHITITPKTAGDMETVYNFTPYQKDAMAELLADRAAISSLAGSLTITNAEALTVLDNLPAELSQERKDVVRVALQLVGKVNYFWGGKSDAIGWDSRWGKLTRVTAPGDSSTGTYRPFGLDCTGFVDWTLRNAGLHSDGHWYIGFNLTEVTQTKAQPGDIALYPDASHVGIVVGWGNNGKLLICHCSSEANNAVVTEYVASGFTILGKPTTYDIYNNCSHNNS